MRGIVGGTDHIDVVASLILQFQHHPGQIMHLHLITRSVMTDVPILAEVAPQATMAKKMVPDPSKIS